MGKLYLGNLSGILFFWRLLSIQHIIQPPELLIFCTCVRTPIWIRTLRIAGGIWTVHILCIYIYTHTMHIYIYIYTYIYIHIIYIYITKVDIAHPPAITPFDSALSPVLSRRRGASFGSSSGYGAHGTIISTSPKSGYMDMIWKLDTTEWYCFFLWI